MKKEALHPNTRRITIDLGAVRDGWPEVSIPAHEFYLRCRPLIQKTIQATEELLKTQETTKRVDSVYVTGGSDELPWFSGC